MGLERKRGKLADLNWLLREAGAANASERFSLVVGDTKPLVGTRYVITLDTDTQLPRDAARQFVGTMAHPLNRPVFDDRLGRVRAGHGILQPRVSPSLPGTNRSRYARMHSGEPGIDPYTRTVSDVYQDLFDEGSFIGKGIYDVDAFGQSLKDRLPDNRMVSHDLFEGCYGGRAGLVSDRVLRGLPRDVPSDSPRRHRWIRGDWQFAAGSSRGRRAAGRRCAIHCRRSTAGRSSTTCAAASSRRRWSCLRFAAGSSCRHTRRSGLVLAIAAPGTYLFTNIVSGVVAWSQAGCRSGTLAPVARPCRTLGA